MTTRTPIRSRTGATLGWVEGPDSLRRTKLTDRLGRTIGWYYADRDVTQDYLGREIGRGNLLLMLLRD